MPELDPARRAVVTGLGAVMPIGNDFPTYWSNLGAGNSGTRAAEGRPLPINVCGWTAFSHARATRSSLAAAGSKWRTAGAMAGYISLEEEQNALKNAR